MKAFRARFEHIIRNFKHMFVTTQLLTTDPGRGRRGEGGNRHNSRRHQFPTDLNYIMGPFLTSDDRKIKCNGFQEKPCVEEGQSILVLSADAKYRI